MIKNLDSYYELMHDEYIPENEPLRSLNDCVKFCYSEGVICHETSQYLLQVLYNAYDCHGLNVLSDDDFSYLYNDLG